ncbi:MAG: type III pantothenate kinase [Acidobacteriota bacterium]
MLLAVDVGNTHTTLGLFGDDSRLDGTWRISTDRERTADEYGVAFSSLLQTGGHARAAVSALAIACVVPPAVPPLREMSRRYFGADALLVEPGVRTGIAIRTDTPREVGADRIANAVAAHERYGSPVVVVDLGTAITLDAISEAGDYLGGIIAPGMAIAAEALFARAAKLPRVELRAPEQVIGKNTVASIRSGLVYGFASLIDGLVERVVRELAPPEGRGVRVISTGGHSALLADEVKRIESSEPDLTLHGIHCIWTRNRAGGAR